MAKNILRTSADLPLSLLRTPKRYIMGATLSQTRMTLTMKKATIWILLVQSQSECNRNTVKHK